MSLNMRISRLSNGSEEIVVVDKILPELHVSRATEVDNTHHCQRGNTTVTALVRYRPAFLDIEDVLSLLVVFIDPWPQLDEKLRDVRLIDLSSFKPNSCPQ
jgi:hypothetical protein